MPLRPTKYDSLVDCLIWHESRGIATAVGKAGEKGILQFMPSTFQHYCVEDFAFKNDIWDTEIQRLCCDYMLQRDFNNLKQWMTNIYCRNEMLSVQN